MAEKVGPEQFAPLNRRLAEKRTDVDEKVVSLPAKEQGESAATSANEKIAALIGQIAADSMDQIDLVIRDLERVRDIVRSEGQRVNREIVGYASLNHAMTRAMKVV